MKQHYLIGILFIFSFGLGVNCDKEKKDFKVSINKNVKVNSNKPVSESEVRYCDEMKEFQGVWIGKVVKSMQTLCICVNGFSEILESCGSDSAFPIKIMSIEKKKSGIFKMQYHTYTDGGDETKPSYVYLKLSKQKLYYQSLEYKFYDLKEIPKWDRVKREFILSK